MCDRCTQAVKKYLNKHTEEEIDYILWELTSFPLGTPETIEQQIIHIAEIGIPAAIKEKQHKVEEMRKLLPSSTKEEKDG